MSGLSVHAISCSLSVFTKGQTLKLKKRMRLSIGPRTTPSDRPVTLAIQTMELDHHRKNNRNLRQRWLNLTKTFHEHVSSTDYVESESLTRITIAEKCPQLLNKKNDNDFSLFIEKTCIIREVTESQIHI